MNLRQAVREILDLVFPPACESCGRVGQLGLCEACSEDIVRIEPPLCSHCGKPVDPNITHPPQICSECRDDLPPYDGARSLALHVGPLREVIITYKFHGRSSLAPYLAGLLGDLIESEPDEEWPLPLGDADLVVPVPLHPERLRWRGFDQAILIARELAPRIEIPLVDDNLVRVKPTLPQIGLSSTERRKNLKNAFTVKRPAEFEGKSALLIDDVYTTGATARDAARALKTAGAGRVFFLTVTRAAPAWHPQRHVADPPIYEPPNGG